MIASYTKLEGVLVLIFKPLSKSFDVRNISLVSCVAQMNEDVTSWHFDGIVSIMSIGNDNESYLLLLCLIELLNH